MCLTLLLWLLASIGAVTLFVIGSIWVIESV